MANYSTLHCAKLNKKLSRIALGTWQGGGSYIQNGRHIGWQSINEKKYIEAIVYSLENGINFIDSSDSYGPDYSSIRKISHALNSTIKAENCSISLKVGYTKTDKYDYLDKELVKQRLFKTMDILKIDSLDVFAFHHNYFLNRRQFEETSDFILSCVESGIIKSTCIRKSHQFTNQKELVIRNNFECFLLDKLDPSFVANNFSPIPDRENDSNDKKISLLNKTLFQGVMLNEPRKFNKGDTRFGKSIYSIDNQKIIHTHLKKFKKSETISFLLKRCLKEKNSIQVIGIRNSNQLNDFLCSNEISDEVYNEIQEAIDNINKDINDVRMANYR
ncbi:hypothetical protein FCV50_23370 [Vibrio kanaloae]|uniref:NADP-dependent oxidoreductase domain-containing protein n=1 Tax=Vibrio kanaloae TaxID=170673 RepID=A0A4U1YSV6_9VIBR|nr:aldo/keto reductase [Vibrio kanaloae]TKF23171.1 hypothetical protein FCV50_23370 [Vibrio kanaloae]